MTRRVSGFLMAAALAAVAPTCLAQQQIEDFPNPGYAAVVASPIGGLSPYLSRDHFVDRGSPTVLHLRFATQNTEGIRAHSFAASGEFPFFVGRLSATGGIQRGDSGTRVMAGIEYQGSMSRGFLTPDPTGPILHLAFKAELGFSTVVEGLLEQTAVAGALSIPMSVPIGREVMLVPFVSPGLGLGLLSTGGTYEFEPQVIVGGGIVLHNPSRLDLTIGAHRVLASAAKNFYGITLTWNR